MTGAGEDWRATIRALTYPIIFSPDPVEEVDRVRGMIERRQLPIESRATAVAAIAAALADSADLRRLNGVSDGASDHRLRLFLERLKQALQAR